MADEANLQVDDKPRSTLLRSFSNSFKKGTANLKRGLTPRSRTSSQTSEPNEPVPPPPQPPLAASASPEVLENHVHVNIAAVDGSTKVTISKPGEEDQKPASADVKEPAAPKLDAVPPPPAAKPAPPPATETRAGPPAAKADAVAEEEVPAPRPPLAEKPLPEQQQEKLVEAEFSFAAPKTPAENEEKQNRVGAQDKPVAVAEPVKPVQPEPRAPVKVADELAPAGGKPEGAVSGLEEPKGLEAFQGGEAAEGGGAVEREAESGREAAKEAFTVDVEKVGPRRSNIGKFAKAALAAAVAVAGAVVAKKHFDEAAEEKQAAEPASVTRAKGFWKRG